MTRTDVFEDDAAPRRDPRTGPLAPPRPAATLLLVDRADGDLRILMGRRHRGHAFMPDKWVFPGGRVDRADYRARAKSELDGSAAVALGLTLPARRPGLARAMGVAAVRETWEEAGLALGDPRPAAPPLADLAALQVLARAVTPPSQPKRFDAVFFVADAGRLHSRERSGVSGELDEIAWFGLEDALTLDLPSVTRFVLEELAKREAEPGRPPLYLRFLRGRHTVAPFG